MFAKIKGVLKLGEEKGEIQRLNKGLEQARKAFWAAEVGADGGPFLVAQGVCEPSFEAWASAIECPWRLCYFRESGDVYAYGDPDLVHEQVCMWFDTELVDQAVPHLMKQSLKFIQVVRGMGANLTQMEWGLKEPDRSYTSRTQPDMKARVVLEVAVHSESKEHLEREVAAWYKSGCILSMGVKVGWSQMQLKLVFIYFYEEEETVIDFSPSECKESNRDSFKVLLPFRCFTSDGPEFTLEFDLYALQGEIMVYFRQEQMRNKRLDEQMRDKKLNKQLQMPDERVICYCGNPDRGEELCTCADSECMIGVFHSTCVGEPANELWACPICVEKRARPLCWPE